MRGQVSDIDLGKPMRRSAAKMPGHAIPFSSTSKWLIPRLPSLLLRSGSSHVITNVRSRARISRKELSRAIGATASTNELTGSETTGHLHLWDKVLGTLITNYLICMFVRLRGERRIYPEQGKVRGKVGTVEFTLREYRRMLRSISSA